MSHEFEQIAQRLKGLREALELPAENFAATCGVSLDEYLKYESGDKDLTISMLKNIADTYNVDVSTLMFDDEPHMSSYFITRKGKGLAVKRIESYKYQTLAGGFNNRKADIFEVTVEPKQDSADIHLSRHNGQEFNLILEGKILLCINGKELILNEGDSIYFDSSLPHGMKALDQKRVRFIAVIL